MSSFKKKILLAVTGSISAYKAADLCSQLKKKDFDIKVILTPSAQKFIGPTTFEALTSNKVYTDDFEAGQTMAHIELARWADLFLIYPCTAVTLNALSSGVGYGILLSTYLAYESSKPLFIAPAMNSHMLNHPTTRASLIALTKNGAKILPTESGTLACGEVGNGRLLSVDKSVDYLDKQLNESNQPHLLITAGGTSVPIDAVRSITNTSTGRTGSVLAEDLSLQGFKVTLLNNQNSVQPKVNSVNVIHYKTFAELESLLSDQEFISSFEFIIHAAAVSDYSPVTDHSKTKLSSKDTPSIDLKVNPKLISKISSKKLKALIAFKLTVGKSSEEIENAVGTIFTRGAQVVVHNDIQTHMSNNKHSYDLHFEDAPKVRCKNSSELSKNLENYMKNLISNKTI